jgi:hypothetical protein
MGSRRRWAAAAAVALLLGTVWALAWGPREAGAEDAACSPTCVILIQVDGLEPKDVTQATTPYMWALAHPTGVPGSALSNRAGWIWQAPRGVAATGTAPATASLLTGAYPEKTGVTGDDFYGPLSATDTFVHQRLGSGGFGDTPADGAQDADVAQPVRPLNIDTIFNALHTQSRDAAVFLGDRGLADMTNANTDETSVHWFPPGDNKNGEKNASYVDSQFTGDPRLCPVPRYPDRARGAPDQPRDERGFNPQFCPANDMTTLHKAYSDLVGQANSKKVAFTFIHLAEYGAAKRLVGDPRVADPKTAPPQPPQALSDTDAAIATFVERYGSASPQRDSRWDHTVLMIVGSHGYEVTPASNRVPDAGDPTADVTNQGPVTIADPKRDLSDFVAKFHRPAVSPDTPAVTPGSLRLVPQGTMATIHYTGDPDARATALKAIKEELERPATAANSTNAACQTKSPGAQSPCIEQVLYVDDKLAKDHPTWHLETHEPKPPYTRTRGGGDLVVLLGPGWASGRVAGMPYQVDESQGRAITNPYTASSGGPRQRAVAALINGPAASTDPGAVRNLDTFAGVQPGVSQLRYPVAKHKVDPSDKDHPEPVPAPADQACPSTDTDPGGLGCANDPAAVADDALNNGHEAQPVTVDFALTISALMQVPFDKYPDQLQGRVLQEAFVNELTPPCVSDCEPPPPPTCFDVASLTLSTQPVPVNMSCTDERGAPLTYRIVSGPAHGTLSAVAGDTVTYTAANGFSGNDTFTYEATAKDRTSEVATATVIVMEPPVVVRPPEFDFYGLVRRLKALVVNSLDQPYARARGGSTLSTIHLEADFGKPETAVTLTFYRRTASASVRNRRVVRLKAIARFDPFVVKRGHVTMRLKVPPQFNPNYIGVTVREIALIGTRHRRVGGIACTTLKTLKPVPFRCTGPSSGVILPIADAAHLHKRKPGRAPRRRR